MGEATSPKKPKKSSTLESLLDFRQFKFTFSFFTIVMVVMVMLVQVHFHFESWDSYVYSFK